MKLLITLLMALILATSGALVLDLTSLSTVGGTLIISGVLTLIIAIGVYTDS